MVPGMVPAPHQKLAGLRLALALPKQRAPRLARCSPGGKAMRFNENASLDSSQVQDRRGGGFGGGSAVAVGGGGLGLVVLVIALLMGVNPGDLGGVIESSQPTTSYQQPADVSPNSQLASECRTGADANNRQDC